MKEYVERERVVDIVHGYCHTTDGRCCGPDDVVELYEELKAIPAADVVERSQWISVKERPPEPRSAREWYLVALESGCVKTLAYEKSTVKGALFHKGWHETASPVTHWMPLPEPPKMDGGADDVKI